MKELENIFSSTPTEKTIICPNPNVEIVIDTREKQSLISANLFQKKANISFEKLEVGDYLIGDTIIERKTFSDFVGSMINKRLFEQLTNLKNKEKKFLLIEGFYYNYEKFNVHKNAIKAMLISIATDFQIPLIFTEDEKDTSDFLILTAKRYEKKEKDFSIRQKKRTKTLEEEKRFILEGFPGIGSKTSKELLEKNKTLNEIFNSDEQKLKNFGMNEKQISEFKRVLEN